MHQYREYTKQSRSINDCAPEEPILEKIFENRRPKVSLYEALKLRASLPRGTVIYELDKNTNRAFIECPFRLVKRLSKEIYSNPSFVEEKLTLSDVYHKMNQ